MPAPIQTKQILSAPGSSPSAAFDSNVTAGSLLVVLVSYYSSGSNGAITVSDDNGNSWSTIQSPVNGLARGAIAYAQNANAGATTVTVTSSGTGDQYITAIACEFGSVLTSGVLDTSVSQGGSGTAANSGSTGTLAQADNVVVGFVGAVGNNTIPDSDLVSGYTNLLRVRSNDPYQPFSAGWKDVSSTASQSASVTLTASDEWVAGCAVFKRSAGGGSPPIAAFLRANQFPM